MCLAQDHCGEKSVRKLRTLPLVAAICVQYMLLVCLAQDRCGEKSVRKPRTLPALEAGSSNGGAKSEIKLYVGGSETTPVATREKNVVRARCVASRMLGELGVAFTVQSNTCWLPSIYSFYCRHHNLYSDIPNKIFCSC